jgi:glycosyltransferase involved in cell wall biosynthesis
VVGFVGRLVRDKGIAELLQAYLLLKPRFPELKLLLVGAPEDGDPLDRRTRTLIETTPGVITTGFVDNVVPLFPAMDVFAMPTFREGFGTASLEAAAAGKPVVTTGATGVIDTVVNGVTGMVVPVGDAEALAKAIARLLEDPELARSMGEAGRRRALENFRPEAIWAGLEGIYRGLLDGPEEGNGESQPRAERPT